MKPSRERWMRSSVVVVPLLLLATVAGCGPLNLRVLGWTIIGLESLRKLVGGSPAPDGALPEKGLLDALAEAIDRSQQMEIESKRNWLREASRRMERPFIDTIIRLEALDEDGFERMWKTDLAAGEARAGDLLLDLAAGMDLHLETGLVPKGILDRRVTLDLRGVSRFEAMERVCAAIGIHADPVSSIAVPPEFARGPRSFDEALLRPWWEVISLRPYEDIVSPLEFMGLPFSRPHDSSTLLAPSRRPLVVLMPGPFPGQRRSIGPFTISVNRPIEYPGDRCGAVEIVATYAAIPEAGRRILDLVRMGWEPAASQGRWLGRLEIDADEEGHFDRRSIKANEGHVDLWLGAVPPHAWIKRRLVHLGPLVREVKVTGRVVASLPGAVETLRIDTPGHGPRCVERPTATASIGERLYRPDVDGNPQDDKIFEIPFELEVPEASVAMTVALDERGVPFELVAIQRPEDGEAERPAETPGRLVLRAILRCSREPASILLKVVHAPVPFEFPFEVTVPLSCFASQPDRPKPLEIEGDSPLDLVVAPNAVGATVFRLTNHSNKGIVRVGYSMISFWIDKQRGQATERVIDSVDGYGPLEGVIVPAGGEVDRPPDFFWRKDPDGDFPKLRVDEVEFTDGTVWKNPRRHPPS